MSPLFESEIKRTRVCLKSAVEELDRHLNTKSLPADDRIYLSEIRWSMMTALGWIDDADRRYAKYYKEDKR